MTRVRASTGGTQVRARVCVRKLPANPTGRTTRVSLDPWSIAFGEGSRKARAPQSPDPDDYPAESFLKVKECVRGWIEFPSVPANARLRSVLYQNSLGDQAAWGAS